MPTVWLAPVSSRSVPVTRQISLAAASTVALGAGEQAPFLMIDGAGFSQGVARQEAFPASSTSRQPFLRISGFRLSEWMVVRFRPCGEATMAEIELRHIEKSYGETAVVKGVSLNIRDGEFLTLVGPLRDAGNRHCCGSSPGWRRRTAVEVVVGGRCVDDKRPQGARTSPWYSSLTRSILILAYSTTSPLPLRDPAA